MGKSEELERKARFFAVGIPPARCEAAHTIQQSHGKKGARKNSSRPKHKKHLTPVYKYDSIVKKKRIRGLLWEKSSAMAVVSRRKG
jgi:hypothetical protein